MVGYFLVNDYHGVALSLFAYAGITDLVDGYIARRYNLQTVVGTIIDPMADKLLMTISVACLAVNGSIPGMSTFPLSTWHIMQSKADTTKSGSPLSFLVATSASVYPPFTTAGYLSHHQRQWPDTGTSPFHLPR